MLMKCAFAALAMQIFLSAPVSAGPVRLQLVKDIDTGVASIPASSDPTHLRAIGGKVYFAASTPAMGRELYVSDGAGAPRLVADISPGPGSSDPAALGMVGPRLLIAADDGLHGEQIWSVDTTGGGAARLTSTSMPSGARLPVAMGSAGNRLIFSDRAGRLWASDGTTGGTRPLDAYGGGDSALSCSAGNRVVWLSRPNAFEAKIQVIDGLSTSAMVLADIGNAFEQQAFAFGDGSHCYFAMTGNPAWTVWRSDGTASGTTAWRRSARGNAELCGIARLGDRFHVLEQDPTTFRLVDVETQTAALSVDRYGCRMPTSMQAVAGRLVFVGPDALSSDPSARILYVSDGTAVGTQRLPLPADIYAGYPVNLATVGLRVIFGAGFSQLYTLDPANATIEPLPVPLVGLGRADMAAIGGTTLMAGNDGVHGFELWRSDGTVAGSAQVHDLWVSNGDGVPGTDPTLPAMSMGEQLYFLRKGKVKVELWRTDGSENGTTGFAPGTFTGDSVQGLVPTSDGVVFASGQNGPPARMAIHSANADLSQVKLVWSDATPPSVLFGIPGGGALFDCDGSGAGNVCAFLPDLPQAAIIAPGLQAGGRLSMLGQAGDAMLFLSGSGDAAVKGLWRSDGTAPGTVRLLPGLARPSIISVGARHSISHQGQVWFLGCENSDDNCALYLSDGTAVGTRRVAPLSYAVRDIVPFNEGVAIVISIGTTTTQLHVSDGTEAGTQILGSFAGIPGSVAAAGELIHFIVFDFNDSIYRVSDGTPAGTRAVALPPGYQPGQGAIVALNPDTVLLPCTSVATGEELCVSENAGSSVQALPEIYPGTQSARPRLLGMVGESAYFSASDGIHGRELWRAFPQSDLIFAHGFDQRAVH